MTCPGEKVNSWLKTSVTCRAPKWLVLEDMVVTSLRFSEMNYNWWKNLDLVVIARLGQHMLGNSEIILNQV